MAKKFGYSAAVLIVAIIAFVLTVQFPERLHWAGSIILQTLCAHPKPSALLLIAIMCIAYVSLSDSANPLRLAVGEDGRLSTSKFQFLLWTLPVIFVVASLMFARKGQVSSVPPNVLIALGFSLSTVVGAKGITVSYLAGNRIKKTDAPGVTRDSNGKIVSGPLHPGDLFENDKGQPDLTKAQMLAWTVVAIGDFLYNFFLHWDSYVQLPTGTGASNSMAGGFPDIDTTLMVLMGLGQGTYLGGKLVSTDQPQIARISAKLGAQSVNVVIEGQNFSGGTIAINGIAPTNVTWHDDGKSAEAVAPNPLGGKPIAAGDTITVSGTINTTTFSQTVQVTA